MVAHQLIQQATRLHRLGHSLRQIQASLGVPKSTLHRWLKRPHPTPAPEPASPARPTAEGRTPRQPPTRPLSAKPPRAKPISPPRQRWAPNRTVLHQQSLVADLSQQIATKVEQRAKLTRQIKQQRQLLAQLQAMTTQLQAKQQHLEASLLQLTRQQRALDGQP